MSSARPLRRPWWGAATVVVLLGAGLGAGISAAPAGAATPLITEQQELLAAPGAPGDLFGSATAVFGNVALVGAPAADVAGHADQGRVSVFVRSGDTWGPAGVLTAPDGTAGARFGASVAIHGDGIIVGAPGQDGSGAAYLFERTTTGFPLRQRVVGTDTAAADAFGFAVAIEGSTAIVGAEHDRVGTVAAQGSAYVFVAGPGGTWSQQAKLVLPDGAAYDSFGSAVALSGARALIGAYRKDNGAAKDTGAAYVFDRDAGAWALSAKLEAADAGIGDQFGFSVDIEGATAVIGSYLDDVGTQENQGSTYFYERRANGTWAEDGHVVASDGINHDRFGSGVHLEGTTALVASFKDNVGKGKNHGAAFVLRRTEAGWAETTKLAASDRQTFDYLGFGSAMDGDTVLLGAPGDPAQHPDVRGAAYVYGIGPLPEDLGDAPGSYGTLRASDGARHVLSASGPRLGTAVDADTDGHPGATAAGDDGDGTDDEDGITIGPLTGGVAGSADVHTAIPSCTAVLDAWVDFNRDGDWLDVGERIANHRTVKDTSGAAGCAATAVNPLPFSVPSAASAGPTFARFRISRDGVAGPGGPAPDGEVEDHPVTIGQTPSVRFARAVTDTAEGKAASVPLLLSRAVGEPVTVQLTAGGTADVGSDHTVEPASLVITFPAGSVSQHVTVRTKKDTVAEPTETVRLTITAAEGATLGAITASTVNIADVPPPPPAVRFASASLAVVEGRSATVNVRLTEISDHPVTVTFSVGGSASPEADYQLQPPTTTVTIPAGLDKVQIKVKALTDLVAEPSETVVLTLTSASGATIGTIPQVVVTISDPTG